MKVVFIQLCSAFSLLFKKTCSRVPQGRVMIPEHALVSENSNESDSQFLTFQKELGQSIGTAEPCPFSLVWAGGAGRRTSLNRTSGESRTEGQRSQHAGQGAACHAHSLRALCSCDILEATESPQPVRAFNPCAQTHEYFYVYCIPLA